MEEEDMNPDYGYSELIYTKDDFQPPKIIKPNGTLYLYLPIVNTSWTKLRLIVTWPEEIWDRIHGRVWLVVRELGIKREEMSHGGKLMGKQCNITLASIGENTVKILFNEKTMMTWTGQKMRFDRLDKLRIEYRNSKHQLLIHGVVLTP